MLKRSRKTLHQLLQYFLCFHIKFNSFVRGLNSYSKIVVFESVKEKCLYLQQQQNVGVRAATVFGWISQFTFKIFPCKGPFAEMFKDIKQRISMLKKYVLKRILSPRTSHCNVCLILTVEWLGLKNQLALLFRKVF